MKPKVLFTIGVLDNGGVAKSILSLLNVFDKEKYDVSLLIAGRDKGRNDEVPAGITIITDDTLSDVIAGIHGLSRLMKRGHPFLALGSVLRLLLSRINRSWSGWLLSRLMPQITTTRFDLAIDYNGQHMLYYMVDKIQAKRKVSFFHSDYKKWDYYKQADRKYLRKVDAIFTISEICVESLKATFPEVAHKVSLLENITSPELIAKQSLEPIQYKRNHKYVLLSLGRVCINKGTDIALDAAIKLKKQGIDFEWLFLGSVTTDLDFRSLAIQNNLGDNMKFLGNVNNPYPYIREADIFVHLSRFEGKSIALDEAKILCKPIVVTNFSSVSDQFTDRHNASICEMTAEDAADKIEELLTDSDLRHHYEHHLLLERRDNSTEVEKLYKMIDL